jgi:MFS transporter, SP family, solute carrier family 2 (myo-inositol transporter), member 13
MYYAASIYEMSEFDEVTAVWLSGFTALAQVIGVVISIYLVDRIGRRTLVLVSLTFVTISLIGLGFTFYLARISSGSVQYAIGTCKQLQSTFIWDGITSYCYDCTNIDGCGYCNGICVTGTEHGPFNPSSCPLGSEWIYQQCSNQYGWLSVFFMVLYLFAFGIGMGGLPWTINSEIYSLKYRSMAVSCSTATNWISNLVVAATFLSISQPTAMTTYGSFWLYASVALIGLIWFYISLPETKGLSLEEIQQLFSSTRDGYGPLDHAESDDYYEDDDDDDSDDNDSDEVDVEDEEVVGIRTVQNQVPNANRSEPISSQ